MTFLTHQNKIRLAFPITMGENDTESEYDIPGSGSARYGNFKCYYDFNPAENRIRLLPDYSTYLNIDSSHNVVCLDIGCNIGELTQSLHKHLLDTMNKDKEPINCHVLAVDLDKKLIERANSSNRNQDITFSCVDVFSSDFEDLCSIYLKERCRQDRFDVVYCFSVTMWIHINHGDEGLRQFLLKLSKLSDLLVLEPQPWKCYGRAVRRIKRANAQPFENFSDLKIRKGVESYINSVLLEECNFINVLQSAPTNWGRQVKFYKKK